MGIFVLDSLIRLKSTVFISERISKEKSLINYKIILPLSHLKPILHINLMEKIKYCFVISIDKEKIYVYDLFGMKFPN
jgi:hypothetical protein